MFALRSLCRATSRSMTLRGARSFSSGAPPRTRAFGQFSRARVATVGLGSGTLLATALLLSPIHADAEAQHGSHERVPTPISSLVRSYVVYTMCSIPTLVDYSPTILSTLLAIPGVKQVTEAFVRVTFFDQFVGSETAEDALPLLEKYRAENKGCLFAYSVEVDEDEAAGKSKDKVKGQQPVYKQIIQEMIHSIDVAADFEDGHLPAGSTTGRKTWVAVKLTALLPHHQSLINLSKYLVQSRPKSSVPFPGSPDVTDLDVLRKGVAIPGSALAEQDITDLKDLYTDLDAICKRAQERGVRIIIDAEHSWYQPAIDAFAHALMVKYNKLPTSSASNTSPHVQPLIYNTYQAYLRRTPEHLSHSLNLAKSSGYALGVKLVRGAYHSQEVSAHASGLSVSSGKDTPVASGTSLSISPEFVAPVWTTKAETDACYNECARFLVAEVAEDVKKRHARKWSLSAVLGGTDGARETPSTPTIGLLFGTHNWSSCRLILDELIREGLASVDGKTSEGEATVTLREAVTERISLAQLYGMHDDLTNYLVDRISSPSPFVIKYVPYGSLADVLPYLSRRAVENKSVLNEGAATNERRRAWTEIRRRVFG